MKNSKENANRWLREAEYTLNQARLILKQQKAYNIACFLAEQACQKSLKAVLYFDGQRFILTHSITDLINQAKDQHLEFVSFLESAGKLDQYYLSSRYPDAVPEPVIPSEIFTEAQAEEAVEIAEKIFNACQKLIRI